MESKGKRPRFVLLGNALAGIIVVAFFLVYGQRAVQLDAWRHYFFGDSLPLEDCLVRAVGSKDPIFPAAGIEGDFQRVGVPHRTGFLQDLVKVQSPYIHAVYECEISSTAFSQEKNLGYLHTGWIFASEAKVFINGALRLKFSGIEKPSLPLLPSDLAAPRMHLKIEISDESKSWLGLSGRAPMVITFGSAKNFRIFGLETALTQIRRVFEVLPQLTLALVLIFGWYYGIRSRIIVATFLFFVISLGASLANIFASDLPWNIDYSYFLGVALTSSKHLAFVLFGIEVIQFGTAFFGTGLLLLVGSIVAQVLLIVLVADPVTPLLIAATVLRYASVALVSLLVWKARRLIMERQANEYFQKIYRVFIALGLFFVVGVIADDVLDRVFEKPAFVSGYMNLVLPFFIGWVLFYTLAEIHKNFQSERLQRQAIERDLNLAHEIQDSLAPPAISSFRGHFKIATIQVKHSQVAGDWMAVRKLSDDHLILITADATGKGVQAALVVHALQSLWADALAESNFDPEPWMLRVNRTLAKLGERKPHSLTLGMLEIMPEKLVYWCAGHVPLFVMSAGGQVRCLGGGGPVLGLKEEFKIQPTSMAIADGGELNIFLGTDGVFHKGTRTSKRDLAQLVVDLGKDSQGAVAQSPVEDDKTLIWISRDQAA